MREVRRTEGSSTVWINISEGERRGPQKTEESDMTQQLNITTSKRLCPSGGRGEVLRTPPASKPEPRPDGTVPITRATSAALKVLRIISNFNLLGLFSSGMEEGRNQNHTQDKP